MALDMIFLPWTLVPDIVWWRTEIDALVGADAIGRDHVLLEVFVLIVSPDQNEVGFELVDGCTLTAKPSEQIGTMTRRRGRGMVASPFITHRGRPTLRRSQFPRQPRVFEHAVHDDCHLVVVPGERRIVSETDRQYFAHLASSRGKAYTVNSFIAERAENRSVAPPPLSFNPS